MVSNRRKGDKNTYVGLGLFAFRLRSDDPFFICFLSQYFTKMKMATIKHVYRIMNTTKKMNTSFWNITRQLLLCHFEVFLSSESLSKTVVIEMIPS